MTDAAGIRVVAIADADSFVKWSAALLELADTTLTRHR